MINQTVLLYYTLNRTASDSSFPVVSMWSSQPCKTQTLLTWKHNDWQTNVIWQQPCQNAYANHALQTSLPLPLLLLLLLDWLRKKQTIQPIMIKWDKTINLMFAQKVLSIPNFFPVWSRRLVLVFKLYRINKWRSPSSVRSVEQLQATMAGQPDFDFNSWGLKN